MHIEFDLFEKFQALPILVSQVSSFNLSTSSESHHHGRVLKSLIFIFEIPETAHLAPMKPRYLEIEQLQAEEGSQTGLSVLSWVTGASKSPFVIVGIVVNRMELPVSDMEVPCLIILRHGKRGNELSWCTRCAYGLHFVSGRLLIAPIILLKLIEVIYFALSLKFRKVRSVHN